MCAPSVICCGYARRANRGVHASVKLQTQITCYMTIGSLTI